MGTRKNLSKTYIVSWYGPFHSVEEMEEWLHQQDTDFCLYLLQGKKPKAKVYSYYCGQTTRTVPKRFKEKDHPIHNIPNQRSIWVGALDNRYNKEDIATVENMFICLLSNRANEKHCLNRQSLYFYARNYNMFLICKWYNPKHHRQPECSIKPMLPEIVAYFSDIDEIKVARRLHSL